MSERWEQVGNRVEVTIAAPLEHQEAIDRSPAKRKVGRCGRRWGKTRWAYKASIAGHGPADPSSGLPAHLGVLQGWDVVWVALDFGQADILWREEIVPRFKGIPGFAVNEQKKAIEVTGLGGLYIKSSENIHTIRGIGKRLMGAILDEGAHYDLEFALRTVVMPALLDNNGWLAVLSTTKAGSYFNAVCEEIQAGQRSSEWAEFHGTPYDNPKLSREAIATLVGEYPPDSPALKQEIFAELVAAGGGLAFPEWDSSVHVLPETWKRPQYWRLAGSMDWGYSSHGCFHLWALGPDHETVAEWEYTFQHVEPFTVGETIGLRLYELGLPEYVAADSQMWAVTQGGPTIAEGVQLGLDSVLKVQSPRLIGVAKGPGSRLSGKMLVHHGLAFERGEDGFALSWARPKILVHPRCRDLVRTIPKLLLDQRNPEDVDTNGPDHWYDSVRYLQMSRSPVSSVPRKDVPQDVHPGWRADGVRRSRERTEAVELEEELVALQVKGVVSGGRYGVRSARGY